MKLPIYYNEVIYGNTTRKVLKQGDVVKCKRCGKKIKISQETVKGHSASDADVVCMNEIAYDDENKKPIICGYRCYAYYYARKDD